MSDDEHENWVAAFDPTLTLAQLIEISCRDSFKAGLRYNESGGHSPTLQARLRVLDSEIAARIRVVNNLTAAVKEFLEAYDSEPGHTRAVSCGLALVSIRDALRGKL